MQSLLETSCYDCHSNTTNYPWYANVQPIGWLLAYHVTKGKTALNFSDFGSYAPRRKISKLSQIENSIADNSMPLASYLLLHKNAKLSAKDKMIITGWIDTIKNSTRQ